MDEEKEKPQKRDDGGTLEKMGDDVTRHSVAGEGFKAGNMNLPPQILQMLLSMDMSPENLKKLQKILDFAFSAVPEAKNKEAEGHETADDVVSDC